MEQEIDIANFKNYIEEIIIEIIIKDEGILKSYWEEVERKEDNHSNTYVPMNPAQRLAVKELEVVWYLRNELRENSLEQIRGKCRKELETSDDCDKQILSKRIVVIDGYSKYVSKNIGNSNKVK